MKVHSIFQSISGEVGAYPQGQISTFIRLQGCNLRCIWCDTTSSQDAEFGEEMTVEEVLATAQSMPIRTRHFVITGGEPLLQKEIDALVIQIVGAGGDITLETNGSMLVSNVIRNTCCVVMDYKPNDCHRHIFAPGKYDRIFYKSVARLKDTDWVKFPIQDEFEFKKALEVRNKINKHTYVSFAFSAVKPLQSKTLYKWLVKEEVHNFVLNTQLHKLVGLP